MKDKFTIVLERDGKRYQLEEIEKESQLDLCKECAFNMGSDSECPRNQHGVWLCSIKTYGKNSHGIWNEVK